MCSQLVAVAAIVAFVAAAVAAAAFAEVRQEAVEVDLLARPTQQLVDGLE